MNVLVSGSSGLIGSALASSLEAAGHSVVRLVRRAPRPGEAAVEWDPVRGTIDAERLTGLDATVHLSGENVVGRWTAAKKARIRDSRVASTQLLSDTLAGLDRPPRVLASASAVGYYGDSGDARLTEDSPPGDDFLALVARDWERATEPAARRGIRVCLLRTGLVLSTEGGALGRMLLPFRLGLGGQIGWGNQYWTWIAIDDEVGAIRYLLDTEAAGGGAFNLVAPSPVTNREFTRTLGRVLGRPTFLAVPSIALRLALGEGAEPLFASQRAEPARLLAAGYRFQFPELEGALRHLLSGTSPPGPLSAVRRGGTRG